MPAENSNAAMPTQQPRVFGGAPATRPDAAVESAPPAAAPSGRLRRKEKEDEGTEMLGWLDEMLSTEKGKDA